MRSGLVFMLLASVALLGATRAARAEWPPCGQGVTVSFSNVHPAIATDGAGGAIVTWMDGQFLSNIFAQHLLASGELDSAWPVGGKALLLDDLNPSRDIVSGVRIFPLIVSDGA